MLRRIVYLSVVALSLLWPPALARAAEPGQKTFVVVRHAEAEPESAGPQRSLTARGRQRALDLARVLGETPLETVYSTQLARTRLTAEPIAKLAGARLVALDDTAKTLAALATAPWGTTTVVVGHSNTVPEIVAGLTHQPFPKDLPVTHDRIWLVTLAKDGSTALVRLRYGAPEDPPPPSPAR